MSAQMIKPDAAAVVVPEGHVTIEIDGKSLFAPKGSMIIHAADKAGVAIPRFCYHDKLAIAANCRMCLVEVEKSPKPMPACATPVMDGMKVQTRSQKALGAQRNVMEFLLINHPLDCPICDQGGECELQDVAMGYGRSVSRFVERKRVVADEDIGPLISTDMTRCIQCTRCVRFVGEVAGTYELGGMSRGENLEIGTYIGKTIDSELGGNIIDVCPVGALTNKVFRFKARAWELTARESIGYHDALGSNLWLHTRRGEVLRTVPRDNEAINECWLSDRDRYSHEGLYAPDRASKPLLKKNGQWSEASWDEALGVVATTLKAASASKTGTLVHPATSVEEGSLLARIMRGLGASNIDHRLRQIDLADAAAGFGFEMPVAALEKVNAALLLGCNLRHELPLVNHRLRNAVKRGARVHGISPLDFDGNIDLASNSVVAPQDLAEAMLRLARAALDDSQQMPAALNSALTATSSDDTARTVYRALKDGASSVIMLGEAAAMHPEASLLRALARALAAATNSAYNEVPLGANAIGLARVGVLPRGGLDAQAMLRQGLESIVLYGVEPSLDVADGGAMMQALTKAKHVIAFSSFASEELKAVAQVILPIAALPENDATLVNLEGRAQVVAAGAKAPGDARPGWKVLRALGGLLGTPGFDFTEIGEVRAHCAAEVAQAAPQVNGALAMRSAARSFVRIATVPIYRGDAVLRRSAALQAHPLSGGAAVGLNPADAAGLALENGSMVKVTGAAGTATLQVVVTTVVPRGGVWIEAAHVETGALPAYGAELKLSKA